MKRIISIVAACLIFVGYAKADTPNDSTAVADTVYTVREKTGNLKSFNMIRAYKTIYLDYAASTLSGEVFNACDEGVLGIFHTIVVSINGKSYYPEYSGVKDRAYERIPLTQFYPEKPDKIICRAEEKKQFTVYLPDHPKKEKGKYKYTIEYEATTPNGGICNWKFTERRNLGEVIGESIGEQSKK